MWQQNPAEVSYFSVFHHNVVIQEKLISNNFVYFKHNKIRQKNIK